MSYVAFTFSSLVFSPIDSACLLSCFSGVQLFVTLWTVAVQAPPSMELSRQEYWSGLPFSPPGDLPDPGMELASLSLLHWQAGSVLLAPSGKTIIYCGGQ